MKFLALIDVCEDVDIERIRAGISDELRGSWQLFASGILREAYATASPARVVFVLEADDAQRAEKHLATLPLIAAGLLRAELIELRPFVNWGRLFAAPEPPGA